ncbi:MAG TPA: MFS transporter [Actinocrinis sp.]|nr:MFS transporter [Actinocrinis sp.]
MSVTIWLLALILFLAGFSISPSLITGFTLVELLVPADRLNEGLATVTTGLAFGLTLGSGLAGPLVDDFGARGAYTLSAAGAACALLAAVLLRRDLIPAPGQPAVAETAPAASA